MLSQPLRHRIQAAVDRRFYQSKCAVSESLAAFSAALRQDVEVAKLRDSEGNCSGAA